MTDGGVAGWSAVAEDCPQRRHEDPDTPDDEHSGDVERFDAGQMDQRDDVEDPSADYGDDDSDCRQNASDVEGDSHDSLHFPPFGLGWVRKNGRFALVRLR